MKLNKYGKFQIVTQKSWGAARGFALLELVIVVIVIAILSGLYLGNGSGEKQAASTYKDSMDRGKSAACLASRSALRSTIITYTMHNPGKPVTMEALKESGVNLNVCPAGGEITLGKDEMFHCSIHQP